jgi:hypothetical protein
MPKNKVKILTGNDYCSLGERVEKWQKRNPSINVVSAELTKATFLTPAKMIIIYNEG